MNRAQVAVMLAAASAIFCRDCSAEDNRPSEKAVEFVERALQAEISGDSTARSDNLQSALRANPDLEIANWQSGMVLRDGRWSRFDILKVEAAVDATLVEYRQLRDGASLTRNDQLKLANWCKKHRLFDRERAHLTAALSATPDSADPAIYKRLGLKLVDGTWMSDEDVERERQLQKSMQRDQTNWQPRIQRLAEKLDSPNEQNRRDARRELEALNDPVVLPALEAVFARTDVEKSRLFVELLGQFKTVKAAEPLTRLSVLSEWAIVRKEAAAKLRERPVGSYAPALLASLATPIDLKVNVFVGADGVHLSQLLTNETQTTVNVKERQDSTRISALPVRQFTDESPPSVARSNRNKLARAFEKAHIVQSREADKTEREVTRQNSEIVRWNDRVCQALADATGANLPADPTAWWDWWLDYNQLSQSSKNERYESNYEEETVLVDETVAITSCLVAGTPIWTERGMLPVETIQVGDLVLSKHPGSGELTYQPVLRTTVRDPQPILKVTTEQGNIRGTGGHSFWISGKGWTMLRDIKAGDRIHGAAQPVAVVSLETGGAEKTYNLVVADFHTYFVGNEAVLSHDVTFAKPTDATVPGMKSE